MQLIPTRRKEKLPQGYSYPIGAQEISEGLFGVPQYQELKISFHSMWGISFTSHEALKKKLKILKISYNSRFISSHDLAMRVPLLPRWYIKIHPLPKNYKQSANEYLINIALPKIKKWLINLEHTVKDKKRTNFCEVLGIEIYLDLKTGQFEEKYSNCV
jgi:hypothetical protein